jgi:branched-chain amino acid transport system permease protein
LTIAFGEMFVFICTKWYTVTRGEDGLLNIRRLPVGLGFVSISTKTNVDLFYFVLVVFAVVVWLLWRLIHSPFGHVMQAIKQNDLRAGFLGYNIWLCKWLVFVLSAMVAGLAGGLFAMAQEGVYVQVMTLQWSGIVVLMTLTGGGLVSFWGPVLGTVVFFVARDILGALTETWLIWYGLMFMVIVMFKPEGIAGMLQDLQARIRRVRAASRPAPAEPARADDGVV